MRDRRPAYRFSPVAQHPIDHGLRPLVASLGGLSASTSIYATMEDFVDDVPGPQLAERLARVADEAARIADRGGGSPGRPNPD